MLKVKPKGFLALVFLIMIGLVPLFYLASVPFPRVNSMTEGRVLKQFSLQGLGFKSALDVFRDGEKSRAVGMVFNLMVNRSLPVQIEKATSDQFPIRDQLIKLPYFFGRTLNNLVYSQSPMPAIPATIEPDTGLYLMRDGSGYLYAPDRFDKEITASIDSRIQNYGVLIQKNPQINWYLYHIETISSSKINPLNEYFCEADRGQAFDYFLENRPVSLHVGNFELLSFEDYKHDFYQTDFHWNIHGALQAYHEVYSLLSQGYPEISEEQNFDGFITFPGVEFSGGIGRLSIYPVQPEPFEVVEYDLPHHKTFVDGQEKPFGKSAEYLAGNYSTEPFVEHYGQYFGPIAAMSEFVFEDNPKRNILVIGDSFDNPLIPLIASHYHHTYSVDFRKFVDFSLATFLIDHPVDDILIIGGNKIALISNEWVINP